MELDLRLLFWIVCCPLVLSLWPIETKENYNKDNSCFCQLKGIIDDCFCSVETLDSFNNLKVYPRLKSLLQKDYFKYWKVNLERSCPFWPDDYKCSTPYCKVQQCKQVPDGILTSEEDNLSLKFSQRNDHSETQQYDDSKDGFNYKKHAEKYSKELNEKINEDGDLKTDDCEEANLGYLNTSISAASQEGFERWAAYDSRRDDSFCQPEDGDQNGGYVNLLLNPERFTSYKGEDAHRIWRAIYRENCFNPTSNSDAFSEFSGFSGQEQDFLKDMCLEKRTFYRAISGLHSSINIHLSSKYLLSDDTLVPTAAGGLWGPNNGEFLRRFEGPTGAGRLKNLYFLYLLELKAMAKVSDYLKSTVSFYTGNEEQDMEVKKAVTDLLQIIESFPAHFDENALFNSHGFSDPKITPIEDGIHLKQEFKQHFRNISRIMDCVGCDKCRLWGKLQVTGLGTALKILFSPSADIIPQKKYQLGTSLTRNEIVALFNAFGRLSNSIADLEIFRQKLT